MGILDGALAGFVGGAAKSGADNLQKDIDAQAKAKVDDYENELAMNRAKAIAQFQSDAQVGAHQQMQDNDQTASAKAGAEIDAAVKADKQFYDVKDKPLELLQLKGDVATRLGHLDHAKINYEQQMAMAREQAAIAAANRQANSLDKQAVSTERAALGTGLTASTSLLNNLNDKLVSLQRDPMMQKDDPQFAELRLKIRDADNERKSFSAALQKVGGIEDVKGQKLDAAGLNKIIPPTNINNKQTTAAQVSPDTPQTFNGILNMKSGDLVAKAREIADRHNNEGYGSMFSDGNNLVESEEAIIKAAEKLGYKYGH